VKGGLLLLSLLSVCLLSISRFSTVYGGDEYRNGLLNLK